MVTKFRQFTKLGHFSFLNCPNVVTIFCQVLRMKIFFFDIPSNAPPIAVRNSLTNQFLQKNIGNSVYFQQQQKMQNWREESFQLFKLSKLYHFFFKFWNWKLLFLISSNPPPIAVWISLTNQFFQKKITFLCIFKK